MAMTLDEPSLGDTLSALPKESDALCKVTFILGPLYHIGTHRDRWIDSGRRRAAASRSHPARPAIAADVLAAGARLLTALENQGYAFAKVDAPVAYEDPGTPRAEPELSRRDRTARSDRRDPVRGAQARARKARAPAAAAAYRASSTPPSRSSRRARICSRSASSPPSAYGWPRRRTAQGRVAVTFQMRERLRHAVSLNAGYSSDLGGSGGVTWTDRNVRGNAEQLDLSATVINLGGTATHRPRL